MTLALFSPSQFLLKKKGFELTRSAGTHQMRGGERKDAFEDYECDEEREQRARRMVSSPQCVV